MKSKFPHRIRYKGKGKKGDTAQLAAQLAPLEEQDIRVAQQQGGNGSAAKNGGLIQDHGALIVDTEHLNIAKGIGEDEDKHFLGIEPVVLVILIAMLAFTAFIAWQISEMPVK
ncbi:MAG TPA: hypothetical protein VJ842_18480 [Pyrinomonadaceae bacterium]|nr:hypothetical protein [Pyrinomonadaceae bacterium]